MSHRQLPPKSTSPFNVPMATGESARRKIDNPKNIGFRGRHAHGKAPDNPVYPTRQLTSSPRIGFVDWRTGGRALLVAAMAAIEGRMHLRTRGAIMKWQMFPTCSPSCGYSCHKARNRVLCSWFTPGTVYEHNVKMDGILTMFKGSKLISLTNPPWRPMSQVALRNKFSAVPMVWENGRFESKREAIDPAFGIRDDLGSTEPDAYDSDDDLEVPADADIVLRTDGPSKSEAEFISISMHI